MSNVYTKAILGALRQIFFVDSGADGEQDSEASDAGAPEQPRPLYCGHDISQCRNARGKGSLASNVKETHQKNQVDWVANCHLEAFLREDVYLNTIHPAKSLCSVSAGLRQRSAVPSIVCI